MLKSGLREGKRFTPIDWQNRLLSLRDQLFSITGSVQSCMTNVRRKYQKIKDKYFTVDVHSGIEPRATRETYHAY